ncbi:hypothetical protein D6817_05815 [Candidatus Pacearchaeota archaeon]|nr:MAG: hypothetical protein D6817_05815 [Candidatus Pacearchaeota archaeon]
MVFEKNAPLYATEVNRVQGEDVLYVNTIGAPFVPQLADNPTLMAFTVEQLMNNPTIAKVVFVQQRNYVYPFEQVSLLREVAGALNYLLKREELLSPRRIALYGNSPEILDDLQYFVSLMKQDPVGCYFEIRRRIGEIKRSVSAPEARTGVANYVRTLEKFMHVLANTRLVKEALASGHVHVFGKRDFYKRFFRPEVLPNFTFTRLAAQLPPDAEIIDQYNVGKEESVVTILRLKNDPKMLYHVVPPEYALDSEHLNLLNLARNVLSEHRPKAEEFVDPERTRKIFMNIARDMLTELSNTKGIQLSNKKLEELARILVRYTIGFGLVEVLISDPKLQDIVMNAPITQSPVFVRHEDYGECVTNIIPSFEDASSWASKLRLKSGRPLDESNPVLDTDLVLEGGRARVAAVTEPLSPGGIAFAFRRHRDKPWTLPLFMKNKTLNSLAAGLLSFIIDGSRTLLIAGTRSSGKTSLLGSLLLEIMPKYRIISVEDTLELPMDALRKLGYDVLPLKVRSAIFSESTEVEAAEGIRTSLRLGDSALVIGEVRSEETKALYEAMRVGALANVVAGTIHGDSPYGVFDRVVNDLGVPPTSFKATDIIVIVNPIKTPDGLRFVRRVTQITEVRKHWTKDPLEEGAFVDLMRYNVESDELEPTPELINGDSEIIKSIAGKVKGWAGDWDAVYDNIILRGKMKQEIVNSAIETKNFDLLEAEFVVQANNAFHRISADVLAKYGTTDSEIIFAEWKNWLHSEIEKYARG